MSGTVSPLLDNRNLTSFPIIPKSARMLRLDICNNPIKTFEGMNTYQSLELLLADNTKLISLKGAQPQYDLGQVSALGTPLGASKHFGLMCLIAFGDSVNIVNGALISDATRSLAKILRPWIGDDIIDGWVILNVDPLIMMDPVTRKRKKLYITDEPRNATEDEVVIVREAVEENKKPEEPRPQDDEVTRQLRNRFWTFQRKLVANSPRRMGSPASSKSRPASRTLRNTLRTEWPPERKRSVSPLRDREEQAPFEKRG